jgi:hypothetical protein
MTIKFRDFHPKRTCTIVYSNYGSYKPYLKKDFHNRCGYTDCPDFWFGGKNNFHIDHFLPWKSYPDKPHLKTDYQNLVYCCSYVNILKSNDCNIYLDPCNTDFNSHFTRNSSGRIIPTSITAQYMYKKLKLYLKRYEIIWMLEKLFNKMDKLANAIELEEENYKKNELKIVLADLSCVMLQYRKYLVDNQ